MKTWELCVVEGSVMRTDPLLGTFADPDLSEVPGATGGVAIQGRVGDVWIVVVEVEDAS